jgi:O-phospho-L-seryl-tRNASec:L-selenocysteinyl-tRNA synthase
VSSTAFSNRNPKIANRHHSSSSSFLSTVDHLPSAADENRLLVPVAHAFIEVEISESIAYSSNSRPKYSQNLKDYKPGSGRQDTIGKEAESPPIMDPNELTKAFQALQIPKNHATVGVSNLIASNKQYRSLFINRRLPEQGWSDIQIQNLLFLFSILDTNNKSLATGGDSEGETRWCGVGEREGRVYSSLVSQRHFGLSHGMGRSGDITEPQPKAAGSSVMVKLALLFTLDALRRGSGLDPKGAAKSGILLPLCTGMTMSLLLSSLRSPDTNKNIVLWSRIDQKSCFKAITSAGLVCVVVPTKINGDEVVTDVEAMKAALDEHGERVLAVITTTSCFAPRVPDAVDEVAKLCDKAGVHHVINNAYGLQCAKTSKLINRACVVGTVSS